MRTRIKELLLEKGMTSRELAEKIGVSPSSLSQSISKGACTLNKLEVYANALDVPVWELIKACGIKKSKLEKNSTALNSMVVVCPTCKHKLELTVSVKTL